MTQVKHRVRKTIIKGVDDSSPEPSYQPAPAAVNTLPGSGTVSAFGCQTNGGTAQITRQTVTGS